MSFSNEIKEKALIACARRCCLCHKFGGQKMQVHHIVQEADGGDNTFENGIPLCLDCHAEVKAYNPHHPIGIKYTETELKQHRDNWYAKVNASSLVEIDEKYAAVDKELFTRIRGMLTPEHMEWLSSFDFDSAFPNDSMKPFDMFIYECRQPEFEFFDIDLEALKAALFHSIKILRHFVAFNTYPCDGAKGYNAVPVDWITTNPEQFDKNVHQINSAADKVWEDYCDFIKVGRRKFACA